MQPGSVNELKGMVGRPEKTVSIDEMNRAVAASGAAAARSSTQGAETSPVSSQTDEGEKSV
jgi:hypothetical protein